MPMTMTMDTGTIRLEMSTEVAGMGKETFLVLCRFFCDIARNSSFFCFIDSVENKFFMS